MEKKDNQRTFPCLFVGATAGPGFEELVYNQGYFKAFLYFWFLVSIPPLHKTHLGPLLLPFQRAGEVGGFNMYNWLNTSTLCHIFFSSVLSFGFFFLGFFIQNVNKMVWTCPWYEGDGGWAVNEGVGGEFREGKGGGGLGNVPQTIMKRVVLKKLWDQHVYPPYGLRH